MKRFLLVLGLVFVCFVNGCHAQDTFQPTTTLPPIQVYFSPKGGCTEAVVKELNAAKTSVLVQAYSFTSAPIAKALLDAHKRGVKVEVILDKS
jgi:phosphatidylserine/phosphatidylglycerophosphate/cardiolipin synthase-like enzyme